MQEKDTAQLLSHKLEAIKLFIFDWDGVFNDGYKSSEQGSGFSENDAMGTNLLRFSQFLKRGGLPHSIILTGLNNEMAKHFASRERFDSIYFGFKNKTVALAHICERHNLQLHEIAFFYDDVLDLSVAEKVGLPVYIKDPAKHRFNDLIESQPDLAVYISTYKGGESGLREACETLIEANGNYKAVIKHRVSFDDKYKDYLRNRDEVSPQAFTLQEGKIVAK